MLRLNKDNALSRSQLAKKAAKKIPLYEERNATKVKVPFLDLTTNRTRYLHFFKSDNQWLFFEIVD